MAAEAPHWLTHLEFNWKSQNTRPRHQRLVDCHTRMRDDQRRCGLSDCDAADKSFEAKVRDSEAVFNLRRPRRLEQLIRWTRVISESAMHRLSKIRQAVADSNRRPTE